MHQFASTYSGLRSTDLMSPTIQLQPLPATFAIWVGRHRSCVINNLLAENRVLKRIATIVTPDTILA